MKERPILFSAPMVRAILEGRKTQTRRVMNPRPGITPESDDDGTVSFYAGDERVGQRLCPYGKPGDRLWVRESFGYETRSIGGTPHQQIVYRASKPDAIACYDCNGMEQPMKWRPSIHMPRLASRILLEITGVRVERLQDIRDSDCCAEGCGSPITRDLKKPQFMALWESINGAGSWGENPWVWVVEFKVLKP